MTLICIVSKSLFYIMLFLDYYFIIRGMTMFVILRTAFKCYFYYNNFTNIKHKNNNLLYTPFTKLVGQKNEILFWLILYV